MPAQAELLTAIAVGAGMGAALVLLVAGIRGTSVDPTRPPSRVQRVLGVAGWSGLSRRITWSVIAAAITLVLTRWPVAAAGIAAVVLAWPRLAGGVRAEQLAIARLEAVVTWTESLRDTISAHASLEQAIPSSTQHAPALIRPQLERLAGRIRVRTPLDAALLELAADLDDASADLVIAALCLSVRRRGERLAQVLSGLALAAREELDLRRRVFAGRAGDRRAVQIVVVITLATAGCLKVAAGAYLAPYSSPAGQVVLALVAAMFAAGFAWMRSLAGDQDVKPFLARPGRRPDPGDLRVVAALTGLSSAAAADLGENPGPSAGPSARQAGTRPPGGSR